MWLRKLLRKLIGTDELLAFTKQLFASKEDANVLKQNILDIIEIIKNNEETTSAALNDINSKIEIIEEKLKKI